VRIAPRSVSCYVVISLATGDQRRRWPS
jgi:hypothetical protein